MKTNSNTEFGTKVASNAFVYTNAKNPHFCESGNKGFLLVEALPNPRGTQVCVLETLENSSGYAIFSNR